MPEIKTPQKKVLRNDAAAAAPESAKAVRECYAENHSAVDLTVHAFKDEAIAVFKELPFDLLPQLPYGYQWAISPDEAPTVIKWDDAPDHTLDLILYGPEKGKINYVFCVDDVTRQSFAHTRKGADPARKYPMSLKDYKVDENEDDLPELEDEDDPKSIAGSYIRGHCIDHKDTMRVAGSENFSTFHFWNYIPEPRYKFWGLQMRRLVVDDLRKSLNGYMQFVHYPDKPFVTLDGTQIPDYLYFYNVEIDRSQPLDEAYSIVKVFNIDWNINYNTLHKQTDLSVLKFANRQTTSPKAAPKALVYDAAASSKSLHDLMDELDISGYKSLNPHRDRLFAQKARSELKLDNINEDFELALQASKLKEAKLTRQATSRGIKYGEELSQLDRPIKFFDKHVFVQMKEKLKDEALGFKDPHDENLDAISKLYKDQKKI